MKQQVTPLMWVVAVVIAVVLLGGIWYVTVGRKTVFIGPAPPTPNMGQNAIPGVGGKSGSPQAPSTPQLSGPPGIGGK